MIRKILVANRGEIACRIIRTCRRLGITAVAAHSPVDAYALHAELADERIALPGNESRESYLDLDRIIAAAEQCGADAVHPGYGFLSENARLPERLSASGIKFIGPPAEAMRLLGDKLGAKKIAAAQNVPLLPSLELDRNATSDAALHAVRAFVQTHGYPVIIKAAAGGGGRGMRKVWNEKELAEALESARREAKAFFGDERVFIERLVQEARHIEVQIVGDTFGNVIHLYDRDCSMQRQHQKVIEEAPAPGLSDAQRQTLHTAAVNLCRAAGYQNAGTVEFLMDREGKFSLLEVNSRLQVEHPVTEAITGVDLVELQIKIADGLNLKENPIKLPSISECGSAIECRICAEIPSQRFTPSTGRVDLVEFPQTSGNRETTRIDAGFRAGDHLSHYYDSLFAKAIFHTGSRAATIALARQSLARCVILGIHTNLDFAQLLLGTTDFAELRHHINYAETLLGALALSHKDRAVIAAIAEIALTEFNTGTQRFSPWHREFAWRLSGESRSTRAFEIEGAKIAIQLSSEAPDSATVETHGHPPQLLRSIEITERALHKRGVRFECDGRTHEWSVYRRGELLWIQTERGFRTARLCSPADRAAAASGSTFVAALKAPLPGKIISVKVREGEQVKQGTTLLSIESMKMEHPIVAGAPCVVKKIHVTPGAIVESGSIVIELDPVSPA